MAAVTRRRFDPEFRAGALRIVKETGKPVAQVARDLGSARTRCTIGCRWIGSPSSTTATATGAEH
ncbi:transposase [Nonomuraea sp. K274]|uniref:Transposase n=1 Tax=Nonomuraea cypriaca TaxID=1187855 RepID=A0A931APQ3_9ACTN|nr:transposase [Nonomuraea cypriaca]